MYEQLIDLITAILGEGTPSIHHGDRTLVRVVNEIADTEQQLLGWWGTDVVPERASDLQAQDFVALARLIFAISDPTLGESTPKPNKPARKTRVNAALQTQNRKPFATRSIAQGPLSTYPRASRIVEPLILQ